MQSSNILMFVLGLAAGSFANVCIFRIPLGESILFPGSKCLDCGTPIKWFQNIPVVSYIFLKGKCAGCGRHISIQYPFIEFLTALLFLLISFRFQHWYELAIFSFFTLDLIIISAIDYRHKVIPDILSYALVAAGLISATWNGMLEFGGLPNIVNSAIGASAGALIIYVITVAGKKVYKKEAMGAGDIKLLAGIGAFLGFSNSIYTLMIASVLGSIIGLSLILSRKMEKRDYLPFGPFLAAGAYSILFISEYFSIFY